MAIRICNNDDIPTNLILDDGNNISKYEVIAMLEDLIKEMNFIKECEQQIYGKEEWNFVGKCQDAVREKIDKLKGETKDESSQC